MLNKNNILIICSLLVLLGFVLVAYGISYNNSLKMNINDLIVAFGGEKDYFGHFFIVGGTFSFALAIIIFFKFNRK